MRQLITSLGLAGLLAVSSLGAGCKALKSEGALRIEECNRLSQELSAEKENIVNLYGDLNNDGFLTIKEKIFLYAKVAKANEGLLIEGDHFNFFKDKNGEELDCRKETINKNGDINSEYDPEELRTLIKWFQGYKPLKVEK
ncbi:MAG: hypothetical protein KKF52_00160 [Nanoarchaeota archaeon]|nr:hypothetical protein [Nanoarchaeota archaeon]MBU4352629.1 hypothetical protein [Nanoarchaeota archaeon]